MCRLFRVLDRLIVSLHKPAEGCLSTIVYARVEVCITVGPHISGRVAIPLKGLSHEIDFKYCDENLQNLAHLRDAAGF